MTEKPHSKSDLLSDAFIAYAESLNEEIGPYFGRDAARIARYARSLEEQLEATQEYICAHDHRWFMPRDIDIARRCPVCGTITFEPVSNPASEPNELLNESRDDRISRITGEDDGA